MQGKIDLIVTKSISLFARNTLDTIIKSLNTSIGVTVGIDKVKVVCESAKQNPGEENSFRQLRLNQWVKQAIREIY